MRKAMICGAILAGAVLALTPAAIASSGSAVYQKMIAKLQSLQTYQATIQDTTVLDSGPGTKVRTLNTTEAVRYKKPNLFSAQITGALGGGAVVSDGKSQYLYSDLANQYSVQPAPKDMVKRMFGATASTKTSWSSLGASAIGSIPVTLLTSTISTPRGATKVTLSIGQKDFLLYKSVFAPPKVVTPSGGGLQVTRTQLFTNVRVNQPISADAFRFTPPADAVKASSPDQLTGGLGLGGGFGQ